VPFVFASKRNEAKMKRQIFHLEFKKEVFCLFRFETPEILSNTKTDEAKQAKRNENEPKLNRNITKKLEAFLSSYVV
jgi:actin-related protein